MKELLRYDPDSLSGLVWVKDMNGGAYANQVAGSLHPDGYWLLTLGGKKYMAHRVVMHLVTGFNLQSKLEIDHKDRDRSNNNVSNLRVVTSLQNSQNKGDYKNNTSGIKGVVSRGNSWRAFISYNGKRTWLGTFSSLFEAACCRKSAELTYQRI